MKREREPLVRGESDVDDARYRALVAHDARFDGVFFVGVKTTGIYCRPVCRAKTPRADRCVFYARAAEAERDGFRACFRCRPERAPGGASVDAVTRTVAAAVAAIEAGALGDGSLDDLARRLGVTSRHLRRSMQAAIGVSPLALALTRRLALARELLRDTSMPITDVAFASGFRSIRRFNDAFRAHTGGRAPSSMRRAAAPADTARIRLTLDTRAPYDFRAILRFLAARAIPGVERVDGDTYVRAVVLGGRRGWIAVSPLDGKSALYLDVAPSLGPSLLAVVARVRRLFDLDARPDVIAAHLARDRRLAPLVRAAPGLRVPGAFDGFEMASRAILGQQISVAAARTIAGRIAARFGEEIGDRDRDRDRDREGEGAPGGGPGVARAWPSAARIAALDDAVLGELGLPRARARALRGIAAAIAQGRISLDPGGDPEAAVAALAEIDGVGPWTAQYVAMRALSWPDAFPAGDLGLRRALGEPPVSVSVSVSVSISTAACAARAERWRPWRAYAAIHLWNDLANAAKTKPKTKTKTNTTTNAAKTTKGRR